MKIFTIEVCGQCPAYDPDRMAYYEERGSCRRNKAIEEVRDDQEPPKECPLKDWKE